MDVCTFPSRLLRGSASNPESRFWVLRSEVETPMNRVFTLVFPDRGAREAFFADPEYLVARATWFAPSVSHVAILDEH